MSKAQKTASSRRAPAASTPQRPPRHVAVVGAGIAGIACARTLVQAGLRVTVFEKTPHVGGRMGTRATPFGSFDDGAQYFTVRDARFARALQTAPGVAHPWSATAVRVLDELGRVVEAPRPHGEPHWVAAPGMAALPQAWAAPLHKHPRATLALHTRVSALEPDATAPQRWQLRSLGHDGAPHLHRGFDAVLLALPPAQAQPLLRAAAAAGLAPTLLAPLDAVHMAPCWTLLAAFPQAMQPGLITLGPQWNAARSSHHRVAWLARESSKPERDLIERWVVHASPAWSQEHLEDDPQRVQTKLLKAFAEITGIRAEPAFATVHRWRQAQTTQPLGHSHLWDARQAVGLCGDWCLGNRVEDAFVSGLELALAVVGHQASDI